MFVGMPRAMKPSTSSIEFGPMTMPLAVTCLRRMAMRVSTSGGWMSVIRPDSKRLLQALLQRGDLLRRPVAGDGDLLAGLIEGVEGMEELLLRPLLVLQELDVVDQQHVVVAVVALELLPSCRHAPS